MAIDDTKAFALISKAAAANVMVTETDLGYMYLSGRGVPVNKYQGMVWTVKGGEQGSPAALSYIASAYFKGEGLPQDIDKAAYSTRLRRAAGQPGAARGLQGTVRQYPPGDERQRYQGCGN